MSKAVKDIAKVSFATLNSRILGLVRDSATMAYLGIGAISAAYTFAFTFPNLFRRLLGEGALTSAMIPVFSQSLKDGGEEAAFEFLNKVVSRAAIVFSIIVLVLGAIAAILGFTIDGEERFVLGAQFSALLMPYMLLICLAAVFSAALNVLGSFGIPSIGPAVLNISIIASLFAGVWFCGLNLTAIATFMCFGWLIGGMFQLAIPAAYIYKKGWRFKFDLGKSSYLSDLYKLFAPACIGAAVIQVNIFVSKILALFVNDTALPALYLSSRLVELPLGVFTIAVATVYFPRLSMLNSKSAHAEYKREYAKGFIMTMCISIPAAFGLAALGRDVLTVLFEWGVFGNRDVNLCLPVLIASVAALPMFALSTFATRGFHSSKDMRTPVKISYVVIVVNLGISLLLMFRYGAVGLALANTAAATIQAFLLNWKLKNSFGGFGTGAEIAKIVAATLIMTVLLLGLRNILSMFIVGKMLSLATCMMVIPAAILIYFAALKLLKFKQFSDFTRILLRKK